MTIGSGFHLSDLQYWRELKILAERASRDVLSGLLNRETATDYIEQCLRHMQPGDMCALFIVDLDNFKQVNDTLGHQAGDQVIRLAAKALSGCFRATDIVGRLGGDEFFALISGPITEESAREKARSICEALQFSIGVNPTLHVSSSVGVYIASGETRAFEKLYERADAALYEAKAEGRNRYHISSGEESEEGEHETEVLPYAPVQLQALLEHMEEGVALLEVQENISVVYASPALLGMLGAEPGSVALPCDLSSFSGIHPDDVPEYERLLRESMASGRGVEYEHRFLRNGVWRWCRARVTRMPASGGRVSMLALVRDVSGARKREDALQEESELLKLALDRGSRVLWELDVSSRRFVLFNSRRRVNASSMRVENFPEGLIERRWVHPDSVSRFRAFARDMLGGRPAGGGAFILRHKMSRRYGWFSVYYRVLPDGDRRPLKVIGIADPLSGAVLSGGGISGRERLWEALRPNLFCYLRLDLTRDRVEALWSEGRTFTQHLRGVSCMELLKWEKKRLFRREDRDEFLSVFGRDALLEAFAHGSEWVTREYRRVDEGGMVRWLSYTAHLAQNPLSGDVQAFGFLQDTERRHAREASLVRSSSDLPVHGIYGRDMARRLAENVLETGGFPLHLLAFVRVLGLSGPEAARRRRFIFMAFSLLLGSDCVMGEHGEDAFTVFRSDAAPRVVTRQRMDEAFAFVRQALFDCGMAMIPRFVAAVACADLCGTDYEALVRRAEQMCGEWENEPSDVIVFIDDLSPFQPERSDGLPLGAESAASASVVRDAASGGEVPASVPAEESAPDAASASAGAAAPGTSDATLPAGAGTSAPAPHAAPGTFAAVSHGALGSPALASASASGTSAPAAAAAHGTSIPGASGTSPLGASFPGATASAPAVGNAALGAPLPGMAALVSAAAASAAASADHTDHADHAVSAVESDVAARPAQSVFPKEDVRNVEPARRLSDNGKNTAIACLEALLLDESPDVVMAEVLRNLGEYYQADRVYTLALVDDGRSVRATHEWVNDGRRSLKKQFSDVPLDKIPMCWRALRENAPLHMRSRGDRWSYAVFPLAPEDGEPDGLLCVENPRARMEGDGLFAVLMPYLERSLRVSGQGRDSGMRDALTGLQNLRAYMDKVCLLTSDAYSSLGAFILDIPGASQPRRRVGQRNSWRILYVAETLSAVFGRELLFRTRSDEFVALCANSTQNVFLARVLRAQSLLQRRYPGQLRFGYSWSEGLFSGDKLVKEARTIMLCNQLEPAADGKGQSAHGVRGPAVAGTAGLESFTIYLQPKVNMRTGDLVGAEVLVRGLDGSGRVIAPALFMESLERTGVIREVDLHVLKLALSTMENWRVRGWKVLPLSVNFSRATMLSASAPGSVLALFSRYPHISPNLLEIEVSENAGDLENRTLERAMAGFRPFGVRFGLDDFGTRYANLSVFANVAFDTVKLDRSLISGLSHNAVGRALVGDIVRLCAVRNMTCVAEGVETQAQIDALLAEGCVIGQGFYYGRPMSAADFERRYLRPQPGQEGVTP